MATLIGGRFKRKPPTTGELRTPLSLVEAKRQPNNDWGFDNEITPFWQGWAKWEVGTGRIEEAGGTEDLTDIYVIRAGGLPFKSGPQTAYFAVVDGKYAKIQWVDPLDQKGDWTILYCTAYTDVSSEPFNNTLTPEDAANEPAPADPQNPFWLVPPEG